MALSDERLLPENAQLGNLRRDRGTLPVRLLLAKFRDCKLGTFISGITPESELLARFKEVRCVKFEIEVGMLPLNLLFDRSRIERFFHIEKSVGNGPEKLLN